MPKPLKRKRPASLFDQQANRGSKFNIPGRRVKGATRDVSRARKEGLSRRKDRIVRSSKKNAFSDRRFGERDPTIAPEDAMVRRRQAHLKSQPFYDGRGEVGVLETLTHGGRALEEMDVGRDGFLAQFSDEEESDHNPNAEEYFGGGLFKKASEAEAFRPAKAKTHREVMDEIITKSKKFRAEKAQEREEDDEEREALDDALKDVLDDLDFRVELGSRAPGGKQRGKVAEEEEEAPRGPAQEVFDVCVRRLAQEDRGAFAADSMAETQRKKDAIKSYSEESLREILSLEDVDDIRNSLEVLGTMLEEAPVEVTRFCCLHLQQLCKQFLVVPEEEETPRVLWPPASVIQWMQALCSLFGKQAKSRHAVMTPLVLMIDMVLRSAPVRSCGDIGKGLLLVESLVHVASSSGTILPVIMDFLSSVLACFCHRSLVLLPLFPCLPSFPCGGVDVESQDSELRGLQSTLEAAFSWRDIVPTLSLHGLENAKELPAAIFGKALELLQTFSDSVDSEAFPSAAEMMLTLLPLLNRVQNQFEEGEEDSMDEEGEEDEEQTEVLAVPLQDLFERSKAACSWCCSRILQDRATASSPAESEPPMKRKRMLPPLDPMYEEEYVPGSRSTTEELKKLKKKVSRETRAAMRDIRRDSGYEAQLQDAALETRDAERAKKLKEVMTLLEGQQAESNKMRREGTALGGGK